MFGLCWKCFVLYVGNTFVMLEMFVLHVVLVLKRALRFAMFEVSKDIFVAISEKVANATCVTFD